MATKYQAAKELVVPSKLQHMSLGKKKITNYAIELNICYNIIKQEKVSNK